MEKDYTSHFSKGDLLILHLDDDSCVHLLIVHILKEDRVFYCWDRTNQTYRLIYNTPKLHMLCPDFDPNYPSDIEWENEWMFEMYLRSYNLWELNSQEDE